MVVRICGSCARSCGMLAGERIGKGSMSILCQACGVGNEWIENYSIEQSWLIKRTVDSSKELSLLKLGMQKLLKLNL